jgi:hypothetical protein
MAVLRYATLKSRAALDKIFRVGQGRAQLKHFLGSQGYDLAKK